MRSREVAAAARSLASTVDGAGLHAPTATAIRASCAARPGIVAAARRASARPAPSETTARSCVRLGRGLEHQLAADRQAEAADPPRVTSGAALQEARSPRAGPSRRPSRSALPVALALALAAAVEQQHAVAVADQHPRVRDCGPLRPGNDDHGGAVARRHVPAGQPQAVGGREAHALVRPAQVARPGPARAPGASRRSRTPSPHDGERPAPRRPPPARDARSGRGGRLVDAGVCATASIAPARPGRRRPRPARIALRSSPEGRSSSAGRRPSATPATTAREPRISTSAPRAPARSRGTATVPATTIAGVTRPLSRWSASRRARLGMDERVVEEVQAHERGGRPCEPRLAHTAGEELGHDSDATTAHDTRRPQRPRLGVRSLPPMVDARADHVGSLLRPPRAARGAREAHAAGRARRAGVQGGSRTPRCARSCALQEEAGCPVVTDGELGASRFQAELVGGDDGRRGRRGSTPGCGATGTPTSVGDQQRRAPRRAGGGRAAGAAARRWPPRSSRSCARRPTAIAKVTLPSPDAVREPLDARALARARIRASTTSWPTSSGSSCDEVRELARLGCRYVQLDAPHYPLLIDPAGARSTRRAAGRSIGSCRTGSSSTTR